MNFDLTKGERRRLIVPLLLVPVLLLASCRSGPRAPLSFAMKTPHRTLFFGNSFTCYDGRLESHFRQLAEQLRRFQSICL